MRTFVAAHVCSGLRRQVIGKNSCRPGNNRWQAVLPSMGTGISYDTAIRHESIRPLAVAPDIEDTFDDFAVS
jgi:hypothetical protein